MGWSSSLAGMLCVLMAAGSPARAGQRWSSFHHGGNTSVELQNLPLEWSPDEGIGWSLELPGYGQSAPVVWQNQVFITAVAGNSKERNLVLSFDGPTGRLLWREEFPATVRTKNSYMVSRAAPTPLVDATGVYVMFESGDLHALSHAGQPLWQRTFFDDAERAFQNGHGYGASPAQTESTVVLLIDHRGPSCLMAMSKETGEIVWKTERSSRASWTSPHVMRMAGGTQVIVSSNGTVDGYDADTGRPLWSHEGLSGNLIPSATIHGDRVYVGASIGQRDSNAVTAAASNCCLQITPGQAPGYRLLWQADKAVCDYASPLAHRDHVYYINKVGVLYCLDAATGQQRYVKRLGTPCWAQPIAAGERLYFFGKNGVTKVIRAGSKFEQLASNRLWSSDAPPLPQQSYGYEPEDESDTRSPDPSREYLDPIVYGVAAVEGAFFVRLGTHLFRVDGQVHAFDKAER